MSRFATLAALVLSCALPASAQDLPMVGPTLGAASNFSQNWQPRALDGGPAIGVTEFRDEVIWRWVEQPDGTLKFGTMRESYPAMLHARDAGMVLLVYSGNNNWEGGTLPRTAEGQTAFARYTAALVARFPAIHTVEVGNEFNADEFAAGESWPTDINARAADYVRLLKTTAEAVRAVNPKIRILGGAAHSIPLLWSDAVMRAGGGSYMDAFVIHPYDNPPEQLRRQIAELRRLPGLEQIPIEVTEFGTTDTDIAPGYLMRMYCQMALSGVTRAVWYPYFPRGDGLEALLSEKGVATDTGRAYALIAEHMQDRAVTDIAPDPFTYGCRFDEGAMVLWGAPRAVEVAEGVQARSASGEVLSGPLTLSQTAPLVLLAPDRVSLELGQTVRLGPQVVLADSYDQFRYPHPNDTPRLFARLDGQIIPFLIRPGQDQGGTPWSPYLGIDQDGSVRATADWVVPSSWGPDRPWEVVQRYTAPTAQSVTITVTARPDAASEDGLRLEVQRDGTPLESLVLTEDVRLTLPDISLVQGQNLDVVIGPNGNATGDFTDLRVTVFDASLPLPVR